MASSEGNGISLTVYGCGISMGPWASMISLPLTGTAVHPFCCCSCDIVDLFW